MSWILSAFSDEAGATTAEQIAACVRGGLKYIDPRVVDGHNISELPLELAEQIARQYEAAGIQVNMYGSPIGKIDIADDFKIDLDKLDHLGRLRDVFGATAVRIFSYYNRERVDIATWRRESMDRLKRLHDRAGKLGLVLYHENESGIFGNRLDNVAAVAELRDGKTFKLIYDFANYYRTGAAPLDCWARFKDKTDCFHIKDQKGDGQHVPIGQGDTEAEAILRDAAESGWSGPCVLEPHLTHSAAVISTGVHGTGDKSLANLKPSESFQIAVNAAKDLFKAVGAKVAK